ncbi:winged helix-turn-helix transcriptional regulator [Candidatus Bathyarchaeota archaeon]|jgi:DNA-binding Lrp family transcriptional regulator|nr:winged helix-turn-helix transcriptional regulator [Candidatus Bathyarchaeota archaeon]
MKELERKLIAELIKNSRRSDRELAKAVGCSQPTVSRMIKRLEKEGYIKEYTMIPDFHRLGYEIMALTFIQNEKKSGMEELEDLRTKGRELEKNSAASALFIMNGIGRDSNRVILSLHESYSSFADFVRLMKQLAAYNVHYVDSFLISTTDKSHSRPLTFAVLGDRIASFKETK